MNGKVWMKFVLNDPTIRPEQDSGRLTLRARVAEKRLRPSLKDERLERASLLR